MKVRLTSMGTRSNNLTTMYAAFGKMLEENTREKLSQVTGFRYFNVYGPREQHKGSMASVAFHLNNQMNAGENPKLFAGSESFKRDFVYVGDVAAVNLMVYEKWCLRHFQL